MMGLKEILSPCETFNKVFNSINIKNKCLSRNKDYPEELNPFLPSKFGSREQECNDFISLIHRGEDDSIYILTGESGIGKSTFIEQDLLQLISRNYYCILIKEYDDLESSIIEEVCKRLKIDDPQKYDIEKIKTMMEKTEKKFVIICDQIERFVNKIEMGDKFYNEHNISALNIVSKIQNAHLIISCRNEYLHKVTNRNILFKKEKSGFICDRFIIYVLKGITVSENMQSKIRETNLAAYKYISKNLGNFVNSNPLHLKIVYYGFFFEKERLIYEDINYLTCSILKNLINCTRLRLDRNNISAETIFSLLYAISYYTSKRGDSVSIAELAVITKIPMESIEIIIRTLGSTNLINIVNKDGSKGHVRIVHDIFIDNILNREIFRINPYFKNAIITIVNMNKKIKGKFVPIWSRFCRPELNLGFFSIISFYAVYILSSYHILHKKYGISLFPQIDLIEQKMMEQNYISIALSKIDISYILVGLMHCLWVTYIYYMDRNYIRYMAPQLLRIPSMLMPLMGSVLGIMVLFKIDLFLLPVMAVGIIYSFILIATSMYNRIGFSSRVFIRGVNSLILMIILLTFQSIYYFYLSYAPVNFYVISITSVLMIYYWYSMWHEHQREHMLSTWLADYAKELVVNRHEDKSLEN